MTYVFYFFYFYIECVCEQSSGIVSKFPVLNLLIVLFIICFAFDSVSM